MTFAKIPTHSYNLTLENSAGGQLVNPGLRSKPSKALGSKMQIEHLKERAAPHQTVSSKPRILAIKA